MPRLLPPARVVFTLAAARAKSSGFRGETMGWSARIAIAILVLLLLGAVALAIYAGTIPPPHHHYEETIPVSPSAG